MQSVLWLPSCRRVRGAEHRVGCGTSNPFQLYGATFIEVKKIVKALNKARSVRRSLRSKI